MTFKTGDKVVHNDWLDRKQPYYVVAEVRGDGSFKIVGYEETGWYHPRYFKRYAEPVTQRSTQQHRAEAIAGGSQEHSVGGAYPLAIVAYETPDGVRYTIENLQHGTVLCVPGGNPRQWPNAELVTKYLGVLLGEPNDGHLDVSCEWTACRPRWDADLLILSKNPPKPSLYEKRKAEEEKAKGRKLTAYEEYYLATAIENGD